MWEYVRKFCILILVALPLYLLLRRPWRRKEKREWAMGAFWLFMAGLLALALEGRYVSVEQCLSSAAERIATGEKINLVPFRTIGAYFQHFIFDVFTVNIVGNIAMFIPWGLGLPLLWKKRQSSWSVLLFSLALPVGIETCQLFLERTVDVDDLILNFAGGCLGAGIFFGLRRLIPGIGKLAR